MCNATVARFGVEGVKHLAHKDREAFQKFQSGVKLDG
jgi:hypothetical protein